MSAPGDAPVMKTHELLDAHLQLPTMPLSKLKNTRVTHRTDGRCRYSASVTYYGFLYSCTLGSYPVT